MSLIGQSKQALDTPALWVDLDRLDSNIAELAAYFKAAGVGWRPHMKGVKIPAIAHKAVNAGALGVTVAKLSEAEVMANNGIGDILIANQVVGPLKTGRLMQLRRQADVKVAVDDPANVAELGAAARSAGVELGILVDINTGMNRTGVASIEAAVALSQQVADTPGLRYQGLMAWEGHAVGMQDAEAKEASIRQSVSMLTDAADACRATGLPVEIVSGGGSGTYKFTAQIPGMTEIQAGGAIFNDAAYTRWGVTTQQALFVKVTVTSRPTPERIIIDAGFKALPGYHVQPEPLGVANIARYSTSAEHGVITLSAPNESLKVGDNLDVVVGYTDATLFLHDQLYGIRDGVIELIWPITARGKLT
ncbi:MAG: DSD1 family PLP-dependent enzyme [Anaerolineales bacterium]|nr:DSD1 family PLP-dependent enzyme [Anaerolineales bacterium]MCB8960889.1 DSD1 family PLP-dependent enzyme [Ardenticatenales bacterium]